MAEMTAWEKIKLVRSFDDGSISTGEKFVLFIIATHLGDNDFAWLSLSTLMTECCQARNNLSKNIKKLIQKGYLIRISPSDGYKSNRFKINFDKLPSSETLLVAKRYQTSSETLPPQVRNATSLGTKRYPNRKINISEKKVKKKRVPRPFVRSLSKSQKLKAKKEAENYEKCPNCQRPALHCECKNGKDKWAPEMREGWDKMMEKLKIQ
jgi:Helix-turn-helix domain